MYFAEAPSTCTKDYTDAYQWTRANVPTIEKIVNGKRYVIFNCREAGPITSRTANKVLKLQVSAQNIDDVRLYLGTSRVLEDTEEGYVCSCKHFKKNYKLGALVREKRIVVPNVAKTVPLGKKRPKGRPPRARAALSMQE